MVGAISSPWLHPCSRICLDFDLGKNCGLRKDMKMISELELKETPYIIIDLALSLSEGLCYRCGNEIGKTSGCYLCYLYNQSSKESANK